MWKKIIVVLAFFFSALLSGKEATRVLVVGDSLSAAYGIKEEQGWVSLLARELTQYQVINASISGDTTAGGLARLPALLEKHKPKLLIIELGGNDGLRGQPLNLSEDNLLQMTQMGERAGAKVLLLGMKIPPNYGATYTTQFEQMYVAVTKKTKAHLVPFFLEPVGLKLRYFQPDRIHPTAEAQALLLKHVLPAIQKSLKQ
ncbi:MAG: hypothetical protein RLZZ502_1682 [Pseudomonadota bacterium]|jgi:acyl-CoA thioesterase-1